MPAQRVSPVKHDVRLMVPQLNKVRADFAARGVNVAAWSLQRGFNPNIVHAVLHGKLPCTRGQAHQVAVELGLKAGVA